MVDGWLPDGFEMELEHDLAHMKEELLAHDAGRYQRRIHSVLFFIPMAALASEPFVQAIAKAFQKVSQLTQSLLHESLVFCVRDGRCAASCRSSTRSTIHLFCYLWQT